jgi:predicted PurR-regulated permease PerM
VNIDKELKLPFYAKATIFLVGLFAILYMLYIAQGIIVPIIFATIFAIVLHPVVNLFLRFKINRKIAIGITLLLTFLVIVTLVALLFSQATRFSESWPILVEKFTAILNQTITKASGYFDINPQIIHDWISKTQGELINNSNAAIEQTLLTIGNGLVILFLVPVYIYMILYYQPLLIEFIRKLFSTNNQSHVNEVVTQTKKLVQRYIIGLLFEAAIVAILYSTGLLIIGIDYAILLGFIAALLNVIPFIGGILALCLILIITIATKNSATYPILVAALSAFIHIIDNSYIIPKIVASKVKINALVSITVVIAAGALLGIPGMIICIPLTGIMKLIFDHIEPLKPWGFFLGNTMQSPIKIKRIINMKKKTS